MGKNAPTQKIVWGIRCPHTLPSSSYEYIKYFYTVRLVNSYQQLSHIRATTMRLLVSHQPPASHFCQPHAHSLFYYLHVIAKMVLLNVTVADINSRKALLDNYSYTCGSSLQDTELPEPFKEVYVRNISCYKPVEKLY